MALFTALSVEAAGVFAEVEDSEGKARGCVGLVGADGEVAAADVDGGEVIRAGAPASRSRRELDDEMEELLAGVEAWASERGGGGDMLNGAPRRS